VASWLLRSGSSHHPASVAPQLVEFIVDIDGVGDETGLQHLDKPVESYEGAGPSNAR